MPYTHHLRVYPSAEPLKRTEQLAWKLAELATDTVEPTAEVTDMVINRVIDNASVASGARPKTVEPGE